MRTQWDEQLLPVLEMMMWFTAPRLDILQLPVCLELLLWIDGFTLLVFILRATSDCDLICVVHAGQWPVSRPEAVICLSVWFQDFRLGDVWNLWTENGPPSSLCCGALKDFNRLAGNEQSDHVLCFRKADHLQHGGETHQKPAVAGKPSVFCDCLGLGVISWFPLAWLCLGFVKYTANSLPASYIQQI